MEGQHGHRVDRSRSRWAQLRHRVGGSPADKWSVLGKDADASLMSLPAGLPSADLDGDESIDALGLTDELDEPIGAPDLDLAALRSDDALLNALGRGSSASFSAATEPELSALLLSWRQDVDSEPVPELVDTETAMHTIFVAATKNRRRPRYLVPLASAAAVLVIVFTGVGLAARDAQPGDTLWGLTQVLYSDHARSVVAADAVRTELSHASTALQEGHYSAARTALAQAGQTLPSVNNEDGQADLKAQAMNLLDQLELTTGNGSLPTSLSLPSTDSISSTLDPSTTPSGPPSSTTTDAPTTTTTTQSPSSSTSAPDSSPPTSPSLQSGTAPPDGGTNNTNSAGTNTGDAGTNAPDGTAGSN